MEIVNEMLLDRYKPVKREEEFFLEIPGISCFKITKTEYNFAIFINKKHDLQKNDRKQKKKYNNITGGD